MSKNFFYLAILTLFLIKSSIARPFSNEEFRNAIIKNTETRWLEEIFDNETDFEFEVESNQAPGHIPSNRDLVKSVSEDYEEYEYYYTYEEDPIIEIRFRRNVEEAASGSENDIIRSTTAGSPLSVSLSNAFPKPVRKARRNRRLKKNLRRNRRLRKNLKKEKKFLSNRT